MKFKPYSRSQRYAHELKKLLGEIVLKEVDTTKIGFVTITNVTISKDLKHTRIYVSVLNRSCSPEEVERFFDQRKKYIRKILGSQITSKSVPELNFYYDDTAENADKLEKIFKEIHQENKEVS